MLGIYISRGCFVANQEPAGSTMGDEIMVEQSLRDWPSLPMQRHLPCDVKLRWKSLSGEHVSSCAVEHDYKQLVAYAVGRDDRRRM